MKLSGVYVILILSTVLFIACKSSNKGISEQEKLKKEILEKEKVLHGQLEADPKLANEMIDKYVFYAEKFPEDKLSAEFLYNASIIAMNFKRYEDAISYLVKVETKYPDFVEYPTCIFLKAYIYENYLHDFAKAEELYKAYLAKFPEHKHVKDAEAGLQFLGIDEHELIKQFNEMNDTIQ